MDESAKGCQIEMPSELLGGTLTNPIRSYPITILTKDNGLVVDVGCKSFVFESVGRALSYIEKYLNDPKGTESLYREGKLF